MTASVTTYPLDFARTRLAGVTGRDIGLVGILRRLFKMGATDPCIADVAPPS